ncbi:hypothetical protein LJC09_01485 [Desulfovibrio sp. OttesenSCG-928-F20]|nr:hypothetical protein [Desulfovibrio sp. OttesenSCG-928-F20]
MTKNHPVLYPLSRLRLPLAFICAFTALLMLWSGLGLPTAPAFFGKALAEDVPDNGRAAALALLPGDRALLLQSAVDSVALGLGGALATNTDEHSRLQALTGALGALTFSLGNDIYFTAWQGTRILHAPLNADAGGLDFAESLDGRGAPFVRGMTELAPEGGFLRVLLPPQRRESPAASLRLPVTNLELESDENGLLPAKPALCPIKHDRDCRDGLGASSKTPDVDQVVYVRSIPDSDWHIAAFLPAAPSQNNWLASEVFSSVWRARDPAAATLEERFRKGLRVSGLSLAGLAGLLLLSPGVTPYIRKDEDKEGDVS